MTLSTPKPLVKRNNKEYFRQVGAEVIRIANKYHIGHAELAVELGTIGRLDKEQAKLEERQRVVEMVKDILWNCEFTYEPLKNGDKDRFINYKEAIKKISDLQSKLEEK